MMKMKKSALAIAMSFGAAFGAVQQADASIYGRSYLEVDNLVLGALGPGPSPETIDVDVTSYVTSLTNTADLNGALGGQMQATCTYVSCPGDVSPVLDANPSTVGSPTAINNNFDYLGEGTDEYSRADSVIYDSAIIAIRDDPDAEGAVTHIEQIAESELQFGETAGAAAIIQSTTGVELQFTVGEGTSDGVFFVQFDAIWDQFVLIDDEFADSASAQSEMNVFFTLSQDGTDNMVRWQPGDAFGNDCQTTFGFCQVQQPEDASLNALIGVTANPAQAQNAGSGSFAMQVAGLSEGEWTFVLNATTKTLLTRVPVPGTLAIFGLGLAAMGMAGRRRKA